MNPNDSETLEPRDAVELYLTDRESELTSESLQSHQYRLERFLEYCEENNIDDMQDVTGRTVHLYKADRQQATKPVTVKGHLATLRVFIRFCERIDVVGDGVADSVSTPTISKGDATSDRIIGADRMESILAYHDKYEYASLHHVLLKLLWETGMRMGAAHSIDISDIHMDAQYVELHHRPSSGTTLKNGERGERHVALSDGMCRVLRDHIEVHRHEVEDGHGREPLITTSHGRMNKSTLRQDTYRATRPCEYGYECPHGRAPDECEGMQSRTPYKCPSSEAPHAIRRGAITDYLSDDVPITVLSDRCNVTESVLDEHYDERSDREQMEQRREHLDW